MPALRKWWWWIRSARAGRKQQNSSQRKFAVGRDPAFRCTGTATTISDWRRHRPSPRFAAEPHGSRAPSMAWANAPGTPTSVKLLWRFDAWKPMVGANLFMRESGAVASQFHIPEAIEPYSAELVSARRRVVLGKKSGLDSIDLKARELNIEVPAEARPAILAEIKRRG